MEVIVILILASLGVAVLFLGVFIWATRSGQFDDTTTPAMRMLTDDPPAVRSELAHPRPPNPTPSDSARSFSVKTQTP